jgi:hypothetical protein
MHRKMDGANKKNLAPKFSSIAVLTATGETLKRLHAGEEKQCDQIE